MVEPRYAWWPPYARSLGRDCIDFWRASGGTLFDWQEFVIERLLGLDEFDRWTTANDGICVARQNGKGVIEQAIEVFFAFELGYPLVMHTAHEFSTSQEHQIRLEQFIQDCPSLHAKVRDKGGYRHANGQESINLKGGPRIAFKARTKGGARGWSGDLLMWDEAMIIPPAVVGAQKPALRASQAPFGQKTIFAGSAVDQLVHEHGLPFATIRERGIQKSPAVSYFEWSAPYDNPDEMTLGVLRDRSWWGQANPSMEHGLIREEYMADEIETMPPRIAAVELGSVGDWPSADASQSIISMEMWDALADPSSVLVDPVWFCVDVSPDRAWCSISAAGKRADGLWHVETVMRQRGTAWVVDECVRLKQKHGPAGFVCDGIGPAGSLIEALAERGVELEAVNSTEHGRAWGFFFDAVQDARLRHTGSEELRSAIRGASTRPLGDSQAWSRKNSAVDITPLVGSTLALGAAARAMIAQEVAFAWA